MGENITMRTVRKQTSDGRMKDAVLILGGAFNPVHTQHTALLCHTKQELEATGQWNILGGYLAAATDGYVLHKLQSRHEPTIKLQHRLAMIKEAMKSIPWLANSPFQEEMLKQHDGSATALGERLKALWRNPNVQVLIVIGGDRMLKKGVPIWRKAPGRTPVMRVGVGRVMEGGVNLLDMWQADLASNLIHRPKEYVLLDIPLRSVSSSIVRTYLHQWFAARDDPDKQTEIERELTSTHDYLDPAVMRYIVAHRNDLYI